MKRRSVIGGIDELDDGDYATLRELPLSPPTQRLSNGDDTASEEGKVNPPVHSKCVFILMDHFPPLV